MPLMGGSVINQAPIPALDEPTSDTDEPQVGDGEHQEHAGHLRGVRQTTLVKVKATALPIMTDRLDPHAPCPVSFGVRRRRQIGHDRMED